MAAEKQLAKIKIVVVGDGNVGKSCFLTRWKSGTFRESYTPPDIFNQHEADITVDGKLVTAWLWYIAGQNDYDRLRPLSYPDTNIFLLAFSVVSPDSLENIKGKWVPEVHKFRPKTPIVLLGLKHDRRSTGERKERDEVEIPLKKALRVAKDIGAVGYYEASSLTGAGVEEVVEFSVKAVLSADNAVSKSLLGRKRSALPFSTNTNGPILPLPPKLPPKEEAPPINIPSSTFAADWSKMMDNPSHSDVVFKLATKTYHAHRYVLACGSDVLRQLLSVGEDVGEGVGEERQEKVTREKVNSGQVHGIVKIQDRIFSGGRMVVEMTFDSDVFSEEAIFSTLKFLYTGIAELNKSTRGSEEIVKLSELFNLPELKMACQNALKGREISLTNENCVAMAKQLFLDKPLLSDVRFRVEGELVHAHRLVLCTRCEVMLSGVFRESQANEIEIPDISLAPFLLFLEYLYTDSVRLDAGHCTGVLELANRYKMGRLMALCELHISGQIERATADSTANASVNVVDILLMSQLHNAHQLSSWCLHFISTNYAEYENKPEEFGRLSGSNLEYVNEYRWPPLSYLTAVEEYRKTYPSKDDRGEKGETRLRVEGGEGKGSGNRLSRLFKGK